MYNVHIIKCAVLLCLCESVCRRRHHKMRYYFSALLYIKLYIFVLSSAPVVLSVDRNGCLCMCVYVCAQNHGQNNCWTYLHFTLNKFSISMQPVNVIWIIRTSNIHSFIQLNLTHVCTAHCNWDRFSSFHDCCGIRASTIIQSNIWTPAVVKVSWYINRAIWFLHFPHTPMHNSHVFISQTAAANGLK